MSNIDMAEVREWAQTGGAIARGYFNNVIGQRKPDRSWVTAADIEIESLLRERILARYPDHGIMGEEQGLYATDREFVWVLDPLDGTDAFVNGLPTWSISIGLLRQGEPYLGVIYVPILEDCYWVDAQGSAYRNETPIQVKDSTSVDRNDWMPVPSRAHTNYVIRFPGKTRSLGSLAVHCCYVARGSAIGAVIGHPHLWDIAAGLAILYAAGGTAVTFDGQPLQTRSLLQGGSTSQPLLIAPNAMIAHLLPLVSQTR